MRRINNCTLMIKVTFYTTAAVLKHRICSDRALVKTYSM